jgi:hypothetical protein
MIGLPTDPLAQHYLARVNVRRGGVVELGVGITEQDVARGVDYWLDWTRQDGYIVTPNEFFTDVWTARKPDAERNDYVFVLERDPRLAAQS